MRKHVVMICAALAGCAEGSARQPDGFDREVRGGASHAARVRGVAIDAVALDEVLRSAAPLAEVVRGIDAEDLDVAVHTAEAGGAPLTTMFAGQRVDGVPIHGAYLYLAARPGEDGELVASSYHLYQGATVDTAPEVGRDGAVTAARAALRASGDPTVLEAELAIWPLAGELTLVWDVALDGVPGRALVIAGGPRAGRVELVDERRFDTRGTVTGWIASGGAPGGRGTTRQVPLAEVTVRAGGAWAETGGDGRYRVDAAAGAMVVAGTDGRAARVESADRTETTASATAGDVVDLVLGSATGERTLAAPTAYHAITRTRAFLLASGFDGDQLGGPLDVTVNAPDSCNAWYDPGQRRLTFLRAGGGCRNSAEATVVAHEYGHFVDDTFGGIVDEGLSEGWGDLLACLSTKQPVIGGDMYTRGGFIRTCDNDYQYPPGGEEDDVHDLGQAWAGFGWHLRAALIAELGAAAGDERARELLLPSLVTNAPDIVAAVREVFLRDDDDGDLRDRTPHWDLILAAAERHGLGFVVEEDLAPPAAVDDLAVKAVTATRVELRWTAPGDDGRRGRAAAYELRWSTSPITEGTFARATRVAAPRPGMAGATQAATVAAPPAERLYVAVRAKDELGNLGPLSNVLEVKRPAPAELFADGAERGLAGWRATGLWHVSERLAARGASSFWYGQEASGDYDTGARNRGTLTSPVIDLTGAEAPALVVSERIDVEGGPDHDRLTIEVVDVDDPDVSVAAPKVTAWTGDFRPRLIDLAGLAGRRVQVRFVVDTVDREGNAGQGWAIDDVRVIADEAAPPPPRPGELVINEVLADPPEGLDANGDGAWSARGDELIELVNAGDGPLDLGGATLSDDVLVRVTFPAGTVLAPGKALVVFGGAAPSLPGVRTVGSEGLFLNNDGDSITVRRPGGAALAELSWGGEGGHDQSLTRQRDGDPASAMVGHRTLSAAPASPGTRADGRPF